MMQLIPCVFYFPAIRVFFSPPYWSIVGDIVGKTLVDCTNPLKYSPEEGLQLAVGFTDSGGEIVQRSAPGVKVVKSFNTYGYENFANPSFPNEANLLPIMFMAGDDKEAKEQVAALAASIGFEPFDSGNLRESRNLEPMAMMWIHNSMGEGARSPHFTWARLTR